MRRDMTAAEALLWSRLRRNGIGLHFRRQQVIDGFIADFYCHAAGLVVEVDGAVHEPSYDEERDAILKDRGLAVVRFTNEEVLGQLDRVLNAIREEAHVRASQHLEQ
jgi:very-short-patch-repair endonuclease